MSDLTAINWLAYVLTENNHAGKDIIIDKLKIECDSKQTQELLIAFAKKFKELQRENTRLHQEVEADKWNPVSEWPDSMVSACRCRRVLVTSPVLQHVIGVCEGFHDSATDKWYIILNNKIIEHKVTYWRHIPPSRGEPLPYKEVQEEVEKLRQEIGESDVGLRF